MKMTLHIDDGLLSRVMEATGAESKTKAIDIALREIDRKTTLMRLANEGLGVTGEALHDAVDPSYDLSEMRKLETPVIYGRKPRSR